MYYHCASELLSKVHHVTDISQIPGEGLNHYTMVYGLDSHKLKDKAVGYQSTHWSMMENCCSNIHAVGARYERAKGYSLTNFHTADVPINDIKSTKEPEPCFKCGGLHSQSRFTRSKSYPSDKF